MIPAEPEPPRWRRVAERAQSAIEPWRPTLRYCMQTEAHVYALAVAASVLLAFYPCLSVMLSFCRNVLHWPAAVDAIYLALQDYFPGELGDFLERNVRLRGKVQFTSMFLLLFTANGVFEPLEVGLNKIWGAHGNRSYVKNQLVSLGLIFMCGGLALLSFILTAVNRRWLGWLATGHDTVQEFFGVLLFKLAAVPISILALFLIYWLLPNRRVEPKSVLRVAVYVGLILESLKYVNLLIWPLVAEKLRREYDVFRNSVTILLWSFLAALILLAGAEWAARHGERP